MSADEIAGAYADVADKLARRRQLDRLFAGRYRRRRFAKADGRTLDGARTTGRNFRYPLSAFSTCTFPAPITVLSEMERTCTPPGEILLLEHGRSDAPPLARLQDWRAESQYEKNGCRLNHDPLATVQRAGAPVEGVSTAFYGLVTAIGATPRGSPDDTTTGHHDDQ